MIVNINALIYNSSNTTTVDQHYLRQRKRDPAARTLRDALRAQTKQENQKEFATTMRLENCKT